MSHPVFLTHSIFNHMPMGSENQWHDFFHTASFELEADVFIPILWLMLFRQENLKWAKYTDEFDISNADAQVDLEEYHDDFGDAQYAYLVVDQQEALANLNEYKPAFIEIFGLENIEHFEQFKTLIEQHFPQYILLRTSGLPLDLNDAEFLLQPLQQLEHFQQNSSQHLDFAEFQRQDLARFDDHPYYFYGSNPMEMITPSLKENVDELKDIEDINTTTEPSNWAIWICTAIVVLATLAVYFMTQSVLYSAVVFFVSAFILGFISSKTGRNNTKQPD